MAGFGNPYVGIAIEAGLVLLLGYTLWRAARLERALGVLRSERGAILDALSGFRDSAELTEQGVARLRALTEGAGRTLGERVGMAETLQSDLAYMIERGVALADRLEEVVRTARHAAPAAPPDAPAEAPADATPPAKVFDDREQQMLRALGISR